MEYAAAWKSGSYGTSGIRDCHFLLATLGTVAHAAGLVDDTVNTANEYSKYPLDNYQLDFYVDTGWDWLPWNWLDGIGKQVMYGLYAITNFYLDNQPVSFQCHGLSDTGSLFTGLHIGNGGFHRKEYADPCRCYLKRASSEGFYIGSC